MLTASGCGIGIDRLMMILAGAENLRDVILFPSMRETRPADGTDMPLYRGEIVAVEPAVGG